MLLLGGLALSPLHAQTAYFAGAVTTLGGGFSGPEGVAVDGSGNVYVADFGNNAVKEMPLGCASSSCVTTLGGGFYGPHGVAVDGTATSMLPMPNNNAVKEMPSGCASSTCVTTLGGGFSSFENPHGVAVDGSGNVYVADSTNNAVKEMPPGCNSSSCVTTLGGGFLVPTGVAVDGSGNVYVADQEIAGSVKEMPPGCASSTCVATLGGFFIAPEGVAVDGSGNVYVAESGATVVEEMPAGCTSSTCVREVGGGFDFVDGAAVDGNGDVYVADSGNGALKEVHTQGVNFGTVAVGATGPALVLYFGFTAPDVGITASVLTQGAQGLDFADAGGGTCDTNGTSVGYGAGDTCTVNVTFAPQVSGARYGAVELLDGSGNVLASGYVQGTGVGPQVSFLPGVQSTVVTGLETVAGVAVDGSGNVYVVDSVGTTVYKETLSAGGYSRSVVANAANNGLIDPVGVAVDGSGNVYIVDFGGPPVYWGTVYKETPTSGGYSQSVVADNASNGLYYPNAVAVDGSGNVYISDPVDQWVVKEAPSGGGYTQSVVADRAINGLIEPCGVAVDGSGNVYIADDDFNFGLNVVLKETLSAGGYTQSVVATGGGNEGLAYPIGVAVDGSGNVFIASPLFGATQVWKETPSAGGYTQNVVPSVGLYEPVTVAVDGKGDVYIGGAGYVGEGLGTLVLKEDFSGPMSMSFASTEVGSTSSDSPQLVTLENIGNAPLTFPVPTHRRESQRLGQLHSGRIDHLPRGLLTSSSAGTLAAGASCVGRGGLYPNDWRTDYRGCGSDGQQPQRESGHAEHWAERDRGGCDADHADCRGDAELIEHHDGTGAEGDCDRERRIRQPHPDRFGDAERWRLHLGGYPPERRRGDDQRPGREPGRGQRHFHGDLYP
jgi:sugar lactone lactonase YvrE